MSQPWERQEGETAKAFAAFCDYRGLGPSRTIAKVRDKYGKSTSYERVLERWSSAHEWGKRAVAYDAHLSAVAVGSVEEGIRQDRIAYRESVKKEAADFAASAVAMRREAMLTDDKDTASRILQRASAVWEKARQVEGMALGLVSE